MGEISIFSDSKMASGASIHGKKAGAAQSGSIYFNKVYGLFTITLCLTIAGLFEDRFCVALVVVRYLNSSNTAGHNQ